MRVLLAVLSVLAGWSLLIVVAVGLLLILKQLENIRGRLQKIAMGVRAIEQQTQPLGAGADALAASLVDAAGTVDSTARHLTAAGRRLDAATPALRARS